MRPPWRRADGPISGSGNCSMAGGVQLARFGRHVGWGCIVDDTFCLRPGGVAVVRPDGAVLLPGAAVARPAGIVVRAGSARSALGSVVVADL